MHIISSITDNNINVRFSGHLSVQGLHYNTIYNRINFDKVVMEYILKELKTIRTEKGLSSRDLSERSRVSKSSILMIEKAKQIPRICVIVKLARGLEMPPEELFLTLISGEKY